MGKEKNKRFERFFDYDCLPCGYSKPCDSYRFSEDAVNLLIDRIDQQDKEIKKLKKELSKYGSYKTTDERIRDLENLYSDYKKENQQLKQSQKQLAIEELEKLRPLITRQTYICGGKATQNEIVKANAYNRCLADIRDILDNQIKQLEAQNEV